jgi:hypothetical protein
MPAKKIAKVVKVVKPQPIVDEVEAVEAEAPVVEAIIEEVVEVAIEHGAPEAPKEPSAAELIGKFLIDAQGDKGNRLIISIGGPSGAVSIENQGMTSKIVFGKSLAEAIQKIGGPIV